MNMITVENGTLRVTLPEEEFQKIGRHGVFDTAMRALGNRCEADLMENEGVDLSDVREAVYRQLIVSYLKEHTRYDLNEVLMRMDKGARMSEGMQYDADCAKAYAQGIINPLSLEELHEWAADVYDKNGDLPRRQIKLMELRAGKGDGEQQETMLRVAKESEADHRSEISRRRAMAQSVAHWQIEITGKMPKKVGVCRYEEE
ncbi:MAG TPA: hypothetical protein DCP92_21205 [Nitrospiraceae bacterium]|jgi:hypothetical protein|nr:hypothetical protein [Nitrospiraceae bacterium]